TCCDPGGDRRPGEMLRGRARLQSGSSPGSMKELRSPPEVPIRSRILFSPDRTAVRGLAAGGDCLGRVILQCNEADGSGSCAIGCHLSPASQTVPIAISAAPADMKFYKGLPCRTSAGDGRASDCAERLPGGAGSGQAKPVQEH